MSTRLVETVYKNSKTKGAARAILAAIAHRANDESGRAYPSLKRISDDAGVSVRTVSKCLPLIEELGEIKRVSRGHIANSNGGQQKANEYLVTVKGAAPRSIPFDIPQAEETPQKVLNCAHNGTELRAQGCCPTFHQGTVPRAHQQEYQHQDRTPTPNREDTRSRSVYREIPIRTTEDRENIVSNEHDSVHLALSVTHDDPARAEGSFRKQLDRVGESAFRKTVMDLANSLADGFHPDSRGAILTKRLKMLPTCNDKRPLEEQRASLPPPKPKERWYCGVKIPPSMPDEMVDKTDTDTVHASIKKWRATMC